MSTSNTPNQFGAKARISLSGLSPRAKAQGKSNSGERDFSMKHEEWNIKYEI